MVARVLKSGHPPETRTRVLTYGHSPGPLKHDLVFGVEGLQALSAQQRRKPWKSSREQRLHNKLRERIGLLERLIYCKCGGRRAGLSRAKNQVEAEAVEGTVKHTA